MPEEKRSKISRRGFLKRTAAGAAVAGAMAVAPTILQVTENAAAAGGGGQQPTDSNAPLVAYVKDAARGEVVVMWGTKEITARDFALVSRLALYTRV